MNTKIHLLAIHPHKQTEAFKLLGERRPFKDSQVQGNGLVFPLDMIDQETAQQIVGKDYGHVVQGFKDEWNPKSRTELDRYTNGNWAAYDKECYYRASEPFNSPQPA